MIFKNYVGGNVKTKHIYLCYVDKYIGAYNPYNGEIRYALSDKFVPFVQQILKDYPEYTPHNVINEGIEAVIRQKILIDIAKNELEQNLYILKGKEK